MSGLRAVGSAVAPNIDRESVDIWSFKMVFMPAGVWNGGMLVLIRSTLGEVLEDKV